MEDKPAKFTDDGVGSDRIARPGRNCRRVDHADRVSFLVDAADYFHAFMEAAEQARHSIIILGWDIDSRLRLNRGEKYKNLPDMLGEFLDALAARRKSLKIHILIWDFSVIFATEREPLPLYKLDWRSHRRVKFKFDGKHPVGASHHQKVVVIDDKVAFAGGMDITQRRWDTPAHLPDDVRRTDPGNEPYNPFHDVQMMVDGSAAAALGELARERWNRVSRKSINLSPSTNDDPWPPSFSPDVENVNVGITVTEPEAKDGKSYELKNLFLDSVARARKFIYIENQYLTGVSIGEELIKRLNEENGPEVVIISPYKASGWLEHNTMGMLRARLVQKIRENDKYDRFRIYYPLVRQKENTPVFVHSKVFICDDAFLRIGSANLSNRSMGYDTECDLFIESEGNDRVARSIRDFRNRLMGEHLGVSSEELEGANEEKGSLIEALESLRGGPRTVEPLQVETTEWLSDTLSEMSFFDPERPIKLDELFEKFVPREQREIIGRKNRRKIILLTVIIVTMTLLAVLWRWTPLREYLDPHQLTGVTHYLRASPWSPVIMPAVYILAGLVMFPITALLLFTAIVFDPLASFVYALSGSVLSAVIIYGLGEILGRDIVRRLAGKNLNKISKRIAEQGILTVATLRVVPVAPFTAINLVAGVSHIRFRDYVLGTIVGMTPGIIAITIFGGRLAKMVKDPSALNILVFVGVAATLATGILLLKKYWRDKKQN